MGRMERFALKLSYVRMEINRSYPIPPPIDKCLLILYPQIVCTPLRNCPSKVNGEKVWVLSNARFIQPDAFADDRDIPLSRGNDDDNMLDGRGRPVGAAWRPYSLRIAGQYLAPWGFTLAASFVAIAGDYSGPVVTKIAAADPIFGPATFTLANGIRVSNPLATTIRFAYPTRGDGQVENDTVRYLQLKLARRFKFGRSQLEVAAIVQNVFNAGSFQQYNASGPNQLYSSNYLAKTALQPPRALQIATTFRF